MEKQDKAWREIQLLIERDKAAALEELRVRPLRIAETPLPRKESWLRFRPAALAAASLLLAATLAALWLLQGGRRRDALEPAASALLADSFLYAATGSEAAGGLPAAGPQSSFFTAWADDLEKAAWRAAEPGFEVPAPKTVERGDPEELRRRIGRTIQGGAIERWLSNLKEFHNEEA